MRTTIDLPSNLLRRAKVRAAATGIELDEFIAEAIANRLSHGYPPLVGGPNAPRLGVLTAEQIDEAMFG